LLVVLALLATACGGSETSSTDAAADSETSTSETATTATADATAIDPMPTPDTSVSSTPNPSPTAEPTAVPDPTADEPTAGDGSAGSPAEAGLAFVLDLLNHPQADADDVAAGFAPEFLQQVPAEVILVGLPELWAAGEWSIVQAEPGEFDLTAQVQAETGLTLDIQLGVEPIEPNLIIGLLLSPDVDTPEVETESDWLEALRALGPQTAAGIFEIVDGECSAVVDLGVDEVMPLGSVFKLWVLAELAHQIESGEASWDETLPVNDAHKSSPDGTIFAMEAGTLVTLRTYAEEMISISDNSATDHLIYRLGRERVEAAIVTSGLGETAKANVPLLTTSDLFRLKFDPEPPNSDDYRALDEQGRRELLDSLTDQEWITSFDELSLTNADGIAVSDPRDFDIEWFATPTDICRTHQHLAELAQRPGLEPIADILSINPTAGMDFDPAVWSDLRYKGGSEPGLVSVAWWMQRTDSRTFVLAGGVANPRVAFSDVDGVAALQAGVALVEDADNS